MTDEDARHQDVVDATADTEANMRTQTVPINMFEASGALVVVAPLPAVTPSDVTVELRGTRLRFWAHVRSAAPRDYLVHEWEYGGYERAVDIPSGYGEGVEASLGSGQLAIRVLKGQPSDKTISVTPAG
jgi:HSP20 family molecular chaperone IbpA